MKKLITLILGVLLTSSIFAEDRNNILKVYNWADYISPEVLASFPDWYKQQTGEDIEIIYNTFDINENMLTQIEVGYEDYDVVCPSEYIIDRMLKSSLLLPLDKSIIPDSIYYFNNVASFAIENFRQMSNKVDVSDYAIGYMWGTTGWLYNEAYTDPKDLTSWDAIFNPKFNKAIYMKDAYRDVYTVMVQYAYYKDLLDSTITKEELVQNLKKEYIDSVEVLLKLAKDNIAGWEVDFGKEEMARGTNYINLSWSGDALWAIQEASEVGINLNYIVPKEGTNIWFDGWVIPKYAQNKKAAVYFIDYMCRPDNAIKNMEEIGYVSVIGTPEILEWAQDTIHDSIDVSYMFGPEATKVRVNPILYPDKSVIDRAALMKDGGKYNNDLTNMWNSVKGDNLSIGWIIVIGIFIVALIVLIIVKMTNKNLPTQVKKKTKRYGK